MKTIYALSLCILGLVATVAGTVVSADDGTSAAPQSVKSEAELLAKLNSEPPFADSTLRRPL